MLRLPKNYLLQKWFYNVAILIPAWKDIFRVVLGKKKWKDLENAL